jgi:hypothetical protein
MRIRWSSRRLKLSSQKRRYGSIQLATSRRGAASSRQRRHCASRLLAMSPARSSTLRCLETAGCDIWNGSDSSPTDASPEVSRARIDLRVGSARAAKMLLKGSDTCFIT